MNVKSFCMKKSIPYCEVELHNSIFSKIYQFENLQKERIVGVPDGCVDIQCVMKDGNSKVQVCGSFREGRATITGTFDRCVGIKLKPGIVIKSLLGNMEYTINNRMAAEDYVNDTEYLQDIFMGEMPLEERAAQINQLFKKEELAANNYIVEYLLKRLEEKNGCVSISELIGTVGYSARYTENLFKDYVGFSMKKYACIIRMQQAIGCLKKDKDADMEIYDMLGYYDQAHFSHEFKKFTCLSPGMYKKSEIIIV